MKKLLVATFVALLMAGCGEEEGVDLCDEEATKEILASAVTLEPDTFPFHHHNGLYCLIGSEEPFTGWLKEMWENGQVRNLYKFESGLVERSKEWRRNGKPLSDMSFIGVNLANALDLADLVDLVGFHAREGRTKKWYENGQKAMELDFDEGKLITAVVWKPNGEQCPVTNFVDGNGVWVWYNEDGTEGGRSTFKDGVEVRD